MNTWMRMGWLAVALGLPVSCSAWRLSVGGGLLAGLVQASSPTGTALGWQFAGQWTREGYVGQRWLVDLTAGQFATRPGSSGLLERGRELGGLVLWERRIPFSYAFRPWLGIGAGVTRYRFDDRLRLNGDGYAVGTYPDSSESDWDIGIGASIPINRSWSIGVTAQTGFPTRISTFGVTVLWRLF